MVTARLTTSPPSKAQEELKLAFDKARTERRLEKIDRTIGYNQATLKAVAREQEARDRRLAIVDAKIEKARKELRKLGLLDPE
jgi:hypothetical protein